MTDAGGGPAQPRVLARTDVPRRIALLRWGFTGAAAVLRATGRARYPLADAAGMAAWAVDGRRRRAAVANHLRLGAATQAEARRRARASFREYARSTVDFVWSTGMTRDQVLQHTRLDGMEVVEAALASGRGAVVVLSHFGNWDFAAQTAWAMGMRMTTVMAPVGNPTLTDLVIWARERNALEVYTPDRAARGLLRALARGRFVALLCDVADAGPETVVRFCGGPVALSLSPAWLALRSGVPIIPAHCRRGRRGEAAYVATVLPPLLPLEGEDAAALTQRLATILEVPIRRHPEQWYPFREVYADRRVS